MSKLSKLTKPKEPGAPTYRRHKQSGQGIVTLPDGFGGRRDVLLGKHGTKKSKAAYERAIAEWRAGKRAPVATIADISVNEVLDLYVRHVDEYYRHGDGSPTSEVRNIKAALRWLKQLYGYTSANEFTSLSLEAVRQKMIEAGLCRNRINKDAARIRRFFKWAASKRLMTATVFQELCTVDCLARGRSNARETPKVRPVPVEVVERTLPELPAVVADMVSMHLLSGMHSGELCSMRPVDIDRSAETWIYRPMQHKNTHRDFTREVALGPRAQEIIRRNLPMNVEAFLFSPKKSIEAYRAKQRANRKSKLQPSQVSRKKKRPDRRPGECYTPATYAQSISCAIRRANKRIQKRAEQEGKQPAPGALIPAWHPHQLRHARATELRKIGGIDLARAVLGQHSVGVTATYAELDLESARKIMSKLG